MIIRGRILTFPLITSAQAPSGGATSTAFALPSSAWIHRDIGVCSAANHRFLQENLQENLQKSGFPRISFLGKILTGNQPDFPMKFHGCSCKLIPLNQPIEHWNSTMKQGFFKYIGTDMN